MIMKAKKCNLVLIVAAVLLAGMFCLTDTVFAAGYPDAEWFRFQNSDENNGVTNRELPGSYDEAALKWSRQMVKGYTTSFTPPLIIGGYIYTASNTRVYKIDKDNGDIKAESDEMQINVSYAMHPMTYCKEKGLLFVPLLNGRVQCLSINDLSLKWISKTYTNFQALSPIIYKDGMVYTGTWSSELTDGVYFGLNAETGKTVWEFRPSEQKTETTARYLDDFTKPTGMETPDNYYTYTAVIKVRPDSGYKFDSDRYGRLWLYTSDGKKVVPDGAKESMLVPCTANGKSTGFEMNDDGSGVIRVRFNCYKGAFTQEGSDEQVSALAIEDLSTPVAGQELDTEVKTGSPVTIESIEWKTGDIPHGFYWAGAYIHGDNVIFGSDDGQYTLFADAGSSAYTDTAMLYAVNKKTGVLADKIEGCSGDIRSTVVYHNGFLYFTSKGGKLYKVKLKSDGSFDHGSLSYYEFDGLMTASPVVHNGRIYVGVSGTGGQFNADGGHFFAVLKDDDKLSGSYKSKDGNKYSGSLIYTTRIAGYPQASALLSDTGNGGKVRLYFTFNAFPGGIYYLEDSPESTGTSHSEAKLLFKPEQAMRQYCLSPICVDSQGTIYIKNDSGYLMAASVNKAYLPSLDPEKDIYGIRVTSGDKEFQWNEPFSSGTLNYSLKAPDGVKKADIRLDVPDGITATINGEPYKGGKFKVPVSEDTAATTVTVKKSVGGKTYVRSYTLNMSSANNNSNLEGLVINTSNTVPSSMVDQGESHTNEEGIGYDPVFDAGTQNYVSRIYEGNREFVNVWVQTEDKEATVKAYPVDGVGNELAHVEDDGSLPCIGNGRAKRIPVYWIKGQTSAEIKVVVTPPSEREEAQKAYNIVLVRSQEYTNVGSDVLALSIASADLSTSGGNRSLSIRAMYGEEDVTDSCTWYSSKPDIVTVDGHGNVGAQIKEGNAIVWACYGAQDTEDRPVSIRVRDALCAAPLASLVSGEYDQAKGIVLATTTVDADIYYNIGVDDDDVEKPTKKSTKYTGPIKIGEAGARKRYLIRAIAVKDGKDPSPASDFEYTIDLGGGTGDDSGEPEVNNENKPEANEQGEQSDAAGEPDLKLSAADEQSAESDEPGEQVEAVDESVEGIELQDTGNQKLNTSAGTGLTPSVTSIPAFANGTSVSDIREKLKDSVKATAKTEDGKEVLIGGENIFWDEKTITEAYDPLALCPESFMAVGRVTLPDGMDPNGSSLEVYVRIDVKEGAVAVPVMTPEPGTYQSKKVVTLSSPTVGAGIFYTRGDKKGTLTYEEPISLAGKPGRKISYKFKMFAMVNGVTSKTVSYKMTIDRSDGASDAKKNSINKITPNEAAALAAEENDEIKAVSSVKVTGSAKKKTAKITFSGSSGAANYRIEYRKAGSSSWKYIWTKGKKSITIGGFKKGTAYEIKIAPYKVVEGYWEHGPWTSAYFYQAATTATVTAGKKSATVKVKKTSGAAGYQVRYSLKKNMKTAAVKTYKSAGKTKLKVSGLKSGKTYYIQTAPYKKVGKKIYTGNWTTVKKVKIK